MEDGTVHPSPTLVPWMTIPAMSVFNPKILDACIRDVSSCLSDNQKADLLLYAMRSLQFDGPARTVIENAVQSCLLISTLSPENIAKARILRARARFAAGYHFGAQEDLQAALVAEPDNPEAMALLHQRSVTVAKLLSPLPQKRERFSIEIWREIASFLPRQDLKALLFVPHTISRVASHLLFRQLDLHFASIESEDNAWAHSDYPAKDGDARHAQRSADILTRIIVDPSFANAVRTLRIYSHTKDSSMAFQTGMLTNALPNLINIRNVHISAGIDSILAVLRVLQTCTPRLKGLSLHSPEGPADLGLFEFKNIAHFSYSTAGGTPMQMQAFLAQNHDFLRTISLDNQHWPISTINLAIRNLTHIRFTGHVPVNSQIFADILTNGRQLESLSLSCTLDCVTSPHIRALQSSLPFLKHFALSVRAIHRRTVDRDLFPAIAEFLRGRQQLRTLQLTAHDESVQRAVGFDASVWGVLPSLVNLKALEITYPSDLTPGLASWLIPRSVRALALAMDHVPTTSRDPTIFLDQLRVGIPPTLRYIGLPDLLPFRNVSIVVDHGFPMIRVLRAGNNYYSVYQEVDRSIKELQPWPKRTVLYHRAEWLEWHGCEDAQALNPPEFA